MPETLLNTVKIRKLESRFDALIERTFFNGVEGQQAKDYKKQVKVSFKSKTFEKQVDKIIDDIYLVSINFTDKQIKKALKATVPMSASTRGLYSEGDNSPLPITEEAVRQSEELADEVVESIVRTLEKNMLYEESPAKLAKIVKDLWGGEKYRATRFVRTFTADIATATSLDRYKRQEIEEYQYYAKIDEKTSPTCRALHGTVFKVDSKEASIYTPPKHFHCRSCILPITVFTEVDPKWRYENRDFTKQMDQQFNFLDTEVDKEVIEKVFENINTFNEKYRIAKWIFDEDIEKRYVKLGVGLDVKA
jgi:SPP1 gp7 family putative phage head morphogenesis protein